MFFPAFRTSACRACSSTANASLTTRRVPNTIFRNKFQQVRPVSQLVSSILNQQREQDALKAARRKELEAQRNLRQSLVQKDGRDAAAEKERQNGMLGNAMDKGVALLPLGIRENANSLIALGPMEYLKETQRTWSW